MVVISDRAWIKLEDLGEAVEGLKKRLTLHPRSTSPHNLEPDPIYLYEIKDELIGIPRDYFLQKCSGSWDIEYDLAEGESIEIGPEIKLWTPQIQPVENVLSAHSKGKLGGILEMHCGGGKTICALEVIRRIGRTALIVVHKEFLMQQWKDRIEEFFPNAKVGIVRQNEEDFEGKDIVLAMLQSLVFRRYSEELYRWPGVTVFDETHRLGSQHFSRVVVLFNSRFRIGLSATLRRADRTENAFFWNLGPVVGRNLTQKLIPKVKRIKTGLWIPRTQFFDPNMISDVRLQKILAGSEKRNKLIVKTIMEAASAGRKIIVFSDLRKHLLMLSNLLKANSDFHYDFYVGSWYHGKGLKRRSKLELEEASKAQIIFATYQMAKEGLDIQELDTEVLALPKTNIIQCVGRILRQHPDKKDPIVVDFVEECTGRLKQMFKGRMRCYKQLGCNL